MEQDKIREAIDEITSNDFCAEEMDTVNSEIGNAICVAIECMEKQISKKLKVVQCGKFTLDYVCPECNKRIISKIGEYRCAGKLDNYCNRCGTRLDWSVENE